MSLLPQRKKSPEEIAKLRESLGILGTHPDENETSADDLSPPVATGLIDTILPTHHEATVVHPPATAPAPPLLDPPHPGPKPVHSLKRSERIPALPVEAAPPAPAPVARSPKAVRSLRKSEQIPVLVPAPNDLSEFSNLPVHRHSDEEIREIRRRESLAMLNPVADPRLAIAHPGLLTPGYLLAVTGSSCFFFYDFPLAATAGCAAAALLIAAFIFLRRPISRHHAAFITVIAMLVIVFGALHYFPHLRHAT